MKCNKCEKEFNNQKALNAHQVAHKKGPRYSVKRVKTVLKEQKIHYCKECKEPFPHSYSTTNQYCSVKCSGVAHRTHKDEAEHKKYKLALANASWWKYQTRKNNQTPPDANLEIIKEIYLNCPEGYQVDHIKPISKGGLHHQDNLQYLTAHDNQSKGNKWND